MRAPTLRRSLEIAANAGIIILTVTVLSNFLWARLRSKTTERFAPPVGAQMPLTDVNWGENGTTLLLVLQKGCRYCEESAAFYRKLYDQRAQRSLPRILAVMPGDKSESLSYLSEHGVVVDDVVSKSLSEVKVSATPTLPLIDRSGSIADVWVGKLKEADERRVIQRIFDLH